MILRGKTIIPLLLSCDGSRTNQNSHIILLLQKAHYYCHPCHAHVSVKKDHDINYQKSAPPSPLPFDRAKKGRRVIELPAHMLHNATTQVKATILRGNSPRSDRTIITSPSISILLTVLASKTVCPCSAAAPTTLLFCCTTYKIKNHKIKIN